MSIISKVRNRLQPITKKPTLLGMPISDLFVWRVSEDWETYFDLFDIPGFFGEGEHTDPHVSLMLFDRFGTFLRKLELSILTHKRINICLADYIDSSDGAFGTFAIFHHTTPRCVADAGSHIAERGYVSYQFRDSTIKNTVHGNLDAVAQKTNSGLQYLMGSALLPRVYHLQYALLQDQTYDVVIVNPTKIKQQIILQVELIDGKKIIDPMCSRLMPGGSHVFRVKMDAGVARLIIKSRLVMARPIIFRIENHHAEVFHG